MVVARDHHGAGPAFEPFYFGTYGNMKVRPAPDHHTRYASMMVVAGDHVLGTQVQKRDQMRAGAGLEKALIAARDTVCKSGNGKARQERDERRGGTLN